MKTWKKSYCLQKQLYQRQIEIIQWWYWSLARMCYTALSINPLLQLLLETWDRILLEINHSFNLFPSLNGSLVSKIVSVFQDIHFNIHYIQYYNLWSLQPVFQLRVVPPMAEIHYCKSPLLTTEILTGSLLEWHLNLPGAWTCQGLRQVPEPDTSWRHWEQSAGWWCWWWGLLGFMFEE